MAEPAAARGLVAAGLAAALMPLNSTMVAVAVPDISADFGFSSTRVTQALVVTYLAAAIALQGVGGKLGDRFGHWRVFTGGLVLMTSGALIGWAAGDLPLLAGSRVLMAAGGALVVPATLALLAVELPPDRRGRGFGAFGAIMSLAAGVGPILGGVLVDAFGWRSVFLVNLPVLAVSALLAVAGRAAGRTRSKPAPTGFDWPGALLLTAGLVVLVTGLQLHGAAGALVTLSSLLLLGPFAWWESKARDPVVDFALFSSRSFAAGTAVVGLLNLVMYALVFEIPLVTHVRFDLGSEATGRLLIFMMLAMVATSLVAGRLVDAYGPRPVALGGTLVCLAGVTMLLAGDLARPGELRIPLTLVGLGIGLANPAAQHASLAGVARARSGMAAGVGSTVRYLGGIAGVAVLGRVLDLGGSPATVLATHRAVLAVFVAVLGAALGFAAVVGSGRPSPAPVVEPA